MFLHLVVLGLLQSRGAPHSITTVIQKQNHLIASSPEENPALETTPMGMIVFLQDLRDQRKSVG